MQKNQIADMAGLREKVVAMYERRLDMGGRWNSIDGRLHLLDEHIRRMGYYQEYREIYGQYHTLKEEVREAELVMRNVERLIRRSEQETRTHRSRGMERVY